jgi:di/tricarboxylate transporter
MPVTFPLVLTFVVLFAAMVLFLSGRLRVDLVALLVLVTLGATGVLTPEEAFSGFSRSAVVAIMAIFIIAESLTALGFTDWVSRQLVRLAREDPNRLVVLVMAGGACLSLFMNTIAAAAVLLPSTISAARRAGIHPGRLLMPLAFGSLLGGMSTLLTSTNIVASSLLQDQGLRGFGLLDFAPLGLPLVAAGIVYMALWGKRLMPSKTSISFTPSEIDAEGDLVDIYRLADRLFRARVPEGSYLIGRPLAESTFRESFNINVVALERDGELLLLLTPDTVIREGDVLVLEGRVDEFREMDREPYLEILPRKSWHEADLESGAILVVEAVLSPRSSLIGKTLISVHFREKYGMSVLAVWRNQRPIRTGLNDLPLAFGDTLLLFGPRERIGVLAAEPDLIMLTERKARAVPSRLKRLLAAGILLASLAVAALRPDLVGEVLLTGAVGMALLGIITMDQAYQAIDWRTVFLVAGMLPMGVAMAKTGAASLLANSLFGLLGAGSGILLVAGFLLLAMLMSQVMAGVASSAVLVPVAIQAANHAGVDPRALVMAVALGTSMAFLTPLGHPVNILVMSPGGYRFKDYPRVGFPLTVLLFIILMLLLPVVWPLTPP